MQPPIVVIAVSGEESDPFWAEVRRWLPDDATTGIVHVIDDAASHQMELLAAHLPGHDRPQRPRPGLREAERHGADALVDEAVAAFGRSAETAIIRGRPGHEIVATAADRAADLIVVGARAADVRVAAGPHSLGHTARFVVDHAPCPVLLIRR